jgi:lactate permease
MLCLVMNSVPVSFGAVGTPTWFGMGEVGLENAELMRISAYSAWIHAVASLFIPLIALSFVLSWREIARNIVFVYLSIAACVAPYVALAHFDQEFPSLVGGTIGLVVSILLAKAGIGLAKADSGETPDEKTDYRRLIKAALPIWGTVLVLVATRVPQLGIKPLLTMTEAMITIPLGTLGIFEVSPSLALALKDIYTTTVAWQYQTLYVPALIPFFLMSCIAFAAFGMRSRVIQSLLTETSGRMVRPIMALLGALVMVKLMMMDGEEAMVMRIGTFFASVTGSSWQYFAAYLGALGSFFSGSATISNLTFSGIQNSIATQLSLDRSAILALQSVGGAMGNMVCINNIVAVCSILGIANREGYILQRTAIPMVLYGLTAAIMGALILAQTS